MYPEEGKVRGTVKEDIIQEGQQGAHGHLELQPAVPCPHACADFTSLNIKALQLPELANIACGSAHMKLAGGPAPLGVDMVLAKVSSSQLGASTGESMFPSDERVGGGK